MTNYNIESRRGDTWDGATIGFIVNNAPLDLTLASISMEARIRGDSTVALLLINGSGITITQPTSGILNINPLVFPMSEGLYDYDMSITTPVSGSLPRVKTYLQGTISIYMDAHYA
jgi:hypothetical protein